MIPNPKIALITGAARRIGREIALTLAREGVSIVIHYDRSAREAQLLQQEIESMGQSAYLVQANFSSGRGSLDSKLKKFSAQVYRQVKRVDILVNNAAIFYPTPLEKLKEKDWNAFIDVNLRAPFFLAQTFGLKMVRQKYGKIINLVDWTAWDPHPRYLPYAISKAGLIAATKGFAKAFAPHVQVLGIAPGPILPVEGSSKKQQKQVAKKTLLKRYGGPQDIAQTVRFFVQDTNFITGAIIPVEGGAMLAS